MNSIWNELPDFGGPGTETVDEVMPYGNWNDGTNEHHNITVTLDDSARKLFLEEGYDEKNGARELRRTIQRLFETEISLAIVEKRCSSGDTVLCRAEDNKLVLEVSTHKSS